MARGAPHQEQAAMTPTLRLAIITIMASFGYLGLAVLGFGGFAAFFSHSPLIALAITGLVLAGVALFSGGNLSPGVREDRANRWVLIAFGLIGLLSAYLPAYTDRKAGPSTGTPFVGLASFSSPPVVRCGSGPSLCLAVGSAGWSPSSPDIRSLRLESMVSSATPDLGLLVNSLGWALAFRSGVGMLLTALLIPPLLVRIGAEEKLLRAHFGGGYEAYCRRTSRLFPGLY
jgi:hypothetical protein